MNIPLGSLLASAGSELSIFYTNDNDTAHDLIYSKTT